MINEAVEDGQLPPESSRSSAPSEPTSIVAVHVAAVALKGRDGLDRN